MTMFGYTVAGAVMWYFGAEHWLLIPGALCLGAVIGGGVKYAANRMGVGS